MTTNPALEALRRATAKAVAERGAVFAIIPATKDLDVRNLDALPRGLGSRYLECLDDKLHGVLIAAQWRRVVPKSIPAGRVLVDCGELLTPTD